MRRTCPGPRLRQVIVGAVVVLAAAAAAPVFAPPEDRTFRYVVERSFEGAVPGRYRLERRIRFAHDRDGIVADVTLDRVERMPPTARPDGFVKGQAPFVGRTLRFHVAPDGTIRAVDGVDAVFAAMAAAIGPAAAAPLAALPAGRRLAMMASVVDRLVAGEDAAVSPGVVPVTLASALPGGVPVELAGTRTVTRDDRGRLRIVVRAQGRGVAIDRTRLVDPATGLVLEERETRTVSVAGASETSRASMSLIDPVS